MANIYLQDFKKYVNTLPMTLDKKEQEVLFFSYSKSKDEGIKQKLIEHNLRLCADYAIRYCVKNDLWQDIDDINIECAIALSSAVEKYDITKGYEFSTFAFRCMEIRLLQEYGKSRYDALNYTCDGKVSSVINKNDDEDEFDVFKFIFDENESYIDEDLSSENFVKDIMNFIDNYEDSEIIKMFYGFGYEKKHLQSEIGQKFNLSQVAVSRVVARFKKKLQEYLTENYPDYCTKNKIQRLKFDSIEERNQYIINSFFGIGIKQKSEQELCDELGWSHGSVGGFIYDYKKTLSEEEKEKLLLSYKRIRSAKKYSDELRKEVFNSYYGIDVEYGEIKNMLLQFGLKTRSAIEYMIELQEERYINDGVYTKEQIDQLNKQRKEYFNQKSKFRMKYSYDCFYGLNGQTKKTQREIGEEFGVTPDCVYQYIKQYKQCLEELEKQ